MQLALVSGCGLKLPDRSPADGANAAATQDTRRRDSGDQETSDRYSSGDLAGAWLLSSQQFRDGISQSDYVLTSKPARTRGFRSTLKAFGWTANDRAIVREQLLGFKFSVTMVYEDGHWLRTGQ